MFKAEMREKFADAAEQSQTKAGAAERGFKELFSSYQTALKKAGSNATNVDYDAFKRSLLKKAKQLKKEQGVNKLHYKIVVKRGKVVVRASSNDEKEKS